MKLYWSYNSIPELADLPKEKRKEVWKTCHLKCWTSWPFWITTVAIIVIGTMVGGATLRKLGYFCSDNHYIMGSFWAGAIGIFITFIITQVEISLARPYIREYLNSNVKTN
jgi:hypothetical protein